MRARVPGVPDDVAERVCAAVARLRGRSSTSCPAWARRSTGRARCWRSATSDLDETLGVGAEGPRGHRARARAGGARGCLSARRGGRADRPARPPGGRAASGRRAVGVGDVLAGHRALAAVDAASRPTRTSRCAPLSARATRTSSVFDAAFAPCSARRPTVARPGVDLGEGAALALPRVASPAPPSASPRARSPSRAGARRLERRRAAAGQGLRRVPDAERAVARAVLRALAGAAAAPRPPPAARPRAAARRRSTCGHPARRCATAASRSSGAGASPRAGRGRSCWCATCRARWRRTRACCCSTCRRRGARAARRGVRVRYAADARHPRAAPAATTTPPWTARRRGRSDWSGGTRIGASLAEAEPRARAPPRARRGGGDPLRRLGPR